MKLWLLEWPDAYPDEMNMALVRAETKEAAIELTKKENFYYRGKESHFKYKFDNKKWTIKEVTIDGPEETVVSV